MAVDADADPWLAKWSDLLKERASAAPVLELGSGSGRDSESLVALGLDVVGVDISTDSVTSARIRAPSAKFYRQDLRDPFPTQRDLGAIVASLSLHYFTWDETVTIAERIRNQLRIGGVLLCRLNSTNDIHYGASGHPAIAQNYFLVDGQPKRFFDRPAIQSLFAGGWRLLGIQEYSALRYERPKVLWEVVLERVA